MTDIQIDDICSALPEYPVHPHLPHYPCSYCGIYRTLYKNTPLLKEKEEIGDRGSNELADEDGKHGGFLLGGRSFKSESKAGF